MIKGSFVPLQGFSLAMLPWGSTIWRPIFHPADFVHISHAFQPLTYCEATLCGASIIWTSPTLQHTPSIRKTNNIYIVQRTSHLGLKARKKSRSDMTDSRITQKLGPLPPSESSSDASLEYFPAASHFYAVRALEAKGSCCHGLGQKRIPEVIDSSE